MFKFIDSMLELFKSFMERRVGVSIYAISNHNLNNARRDCADQRRTCKVLTCTGWATYRLKELKPRTWETPETQLKKEVKGMGLYEHVYPEFRQ